MQLSVTQRAIRLCVNTGRGRSAPFWLIADICSNPQALTITQRDVSASGFLAISGLAVSAFKEVSRDMGTDGFHCLLHYFSSGPTAWWSTPATAHPRGAAPSSTRSASAASPTASATSPACAPGSRGPLRVSHGRDDTAKRSFDELAGCAVELAHGDIPACVTVL